MKTREHHYRLQVNWTGNRGSGTANYTAYSRDHEISAEGKPVIKGSSDPVFRGDSTRYNPEELLLAALSTCHMLSCLHLCADAGVIVVGYEDQPTGLMVLDGTGGGRFHEVVLHPLVRLANEEAAVRLPALHERAHELCFIASSVNFPVRCEPRSG
jgi:organic hydroperoxide reductase OsmC/OhrA